MTSVSNFELERADHLQCAARWRHAYREWGGSFALPLYLKREEHLAMEDFCRTSMRTWLLKDADGAVLASCETYRATLWAADAEGPIEPLHMETIATVLVEPALRGRGYASEMLRQLHETLRFEGVAAASLYSDVGTKMYRQQGYLLHPSRESVLSTSVATHVWPHEAEELGVGDVADAIAHEAERVPRWLASASATAVAEQPSAARLAWFHQRAQYRAWAQGKTPADVVGAKTPDGGYALWCEESPDPVLQMLLWRPNSPRDAFVLTQAALAHASARALGEIIWWDADRDTGVDPFRQPALQLIGAVARDREKSLPMLAWLADRPFPLVWAGIEKFGWA